ncbi:androgen-dependent TFPI-regulating protein isoform X3 [Heterocephalus glaber]|uniref:Androgen-dependent TFPI-regulating protein isoform X3 n=1 Tax=Heterocephalus glaber TaxID=10181 RepID=A0AAX6T6W9_HETGA|nr:androgen-dependent TFPI-regulating protein isoform X3 [Heterocephalus glaber]
MTRTSTCAYHFILWNWYIFLNVYIPQLGTIFQDGAQTKYLTLFNLLLQAVFFGVACLDDVLKRIKGRKDIKFITAFRDLLFTTLAFPICTHSFILLFSLIEIILRPHHYPSRKTGLTLLAVSSVGYISRILWLHSKTGQWVYPMLARLSPVGLTAFFFLSYISAASIYLLGERLNHWKWGDARELHPNLCRRKAESPTFPHTTCSPAFLFY